MIRVRRPTGQISLSLLDTLFPPQPQPETPPVVASPVSQVKVQTKFTPAPKVAEVIEHPSVTLHKSGRRLYIKPNDPFSVDVVRDLKDRAQVSSLRNKDGVVAMMCMGKPEYYGLPAQNPTITVDLKDVDLWKCLNFDVEQHPYTKLVQSYGIKVYVAPTLRNYMKKEASRQKLEAAPFVTPPVQTTISLFDRCCEGTILRCTKTLTQADTPIFTQGERYMVVQAGGEGNEAVVLSTRAMASKATLEAAGNGARFEWSTFMDPMEGHFDDSENADAGPTINQLYPERVQQMQDKLKMLNLPLYEHVAEDAAVAALKRGALNTYLMRMGKTSWGITVGELSGSQKIAILSPGNARIFWEKEFQRMGFEENKDYTVIRDFEDTKSPAKYHLITYTWLRQGEDQARKARNDWNTWLKPSARPVKQMVDGEKKTVELPLTNDCPHCKQPMERRILNEETMQYQWTTSRGYMCRNTSCVWRTDNRGKTGAAWNAKKLVTHQGHYIDLGLAMHSRCPDERVKGRFCPTCKQADAVWVPARYKRLKKRYTQVQPDEIHGCKDDLTATSQAAFNMRARRRYGMTGTLISNSPLDCYWPGHWTQNSPSQNFPYQGQPGEKQFDTRFCDQIFLERPAGSETDEAGNTVQLTKMVKKRIPFLRNPPDFWVFMADKMLRRTYQDPLFLKTLTANGRMMPEVEIHKALCPMVPAQAALMLAAMKDFKGTFEKLQAQAKAKNQEVNPTLVISQMTSMGVIATCPEMLNEKFGSEVYLGLDGGGKLNQIRRIVEERVKEQGGKVLILSDFLTMQKTVENRLKDDFGVIRFKTSWDDDTRKEAFEDFQGNPDRQVFIAGTRAVREGVDLSAADDVICCDLLWSPAFQTQAWSRIMAPSTRKRICRVWLMLSRNSIDEHKYNVFYSKMVVAQQALDRRVMEKRAVSVDIASFVEKILEETMQLQSYLRDQGVDEMTLPELKLSDLEMRVA